MSTHGPDGTPWRERRESPPDSQPMSRVTQMSTKPSPSRSASSPANEGRIGDGSTSASNARGRSASATQITSGCPSPVPSPRRRTSTRSSPLSSAAMSALERLALLSGVTSGDDPSCVHGPPQTIASSVSRRAISASIQPSWSTSAVVTATAADSPRSRGAPNDSPSHGMSVAEPLAAIRSRSPSRSMSAVARPAHRLVLGQTDDAEHGDRHGEQGDRRPDRARDAAAVVSGSGQTRGPAGTSAGWWSGSRRGSARA